MGPGFRQDDIAEMLRFNFEATGFVSASESGSEVDILSQHNLPKISRWSCHEQAEPGSTPFVVNGQPAIPGERSRRRGNAG